MRKKYKNLIIFIITLTVTVAAVSLVDVYSFRSFYMLAKEEEITLCEKQIRSDATEINDYLTIGVDTVEIASLMADRLLKEGKGNEGILDLLCDVTDRYAEITNSGFSGVYGVFNGEYLDGTGWEPEENYDLYSRPWYVAAKEANGKRAFVSPYVDSMTGDVIISVSMLLSDGVSAIALDIDLEKVIDIAENIGKDVGGYGFLVSDSGILIAHGEGLRSGTNLADAAPAEGLQAEACKVFAEFSKHAENENEETIFTISDGKNEKIVFATEFGNGLCAVMVLEPAAIFESATKVLYTSVALSLLIIGVVAYFCINSTLTRTSLEKNAVELKKNAEALRRASVEKSRFLANMSHEIRTPINAVLGMNEMILRENDNDTIAGYSDNIQSAGKTLLSLVNDVLDFSKIEAGEMPIMQYEYSSMTLLNDAFNVVAKRAKDKGIELIVYNNTLVPSKLIGDETRIRQIVTNLVTNAIKYTNEGVVTVEMDFSWTGSGSGDLSISVSDTGNGISEKDRERLFSSYTRVDEKNINIEGTGLGLAITKQLVDLMDGELKLESEYGVGSKFTAVIPQKIADDSPMGVFSESFENKKTTAHAYKESFHAPTAKILVVDDVEMNLEVITGLLKKTCVQIVAINNGADAVDLAKENPYDLILMDHLMPDMDGVETMHRIKEKSDGRNGSTPIIVLTANAVSGAREEYLSEGFSDYLSKPVQGIALERMIMKYLPKDKIEWENEEAVAEAEHMPAEQLERTNRTKAVEVTTVKSETVLNSSRKNDDDAKNIKADVIIDDINTGKSESIPSSNDKTKTGFRGLIPTLRDKLFGEYTDLASRLMSIAALCMVVCGILATIWSIIAGESLTSILAIFSCVILGAFYLVLTYLGKTTMFASFFVVFMVTDVFFPIMYFNSGGVKSGMPVWFVWGLLIPWVLLNGKCRIVMHILNLLTCTGCIMLERYGILTVTTLLSDAKIAYDVLGAIFIVSSLVAAFLSHQSKILRHQTEKLVQKTDELNTSFIEIDRANRAKAEFLSNMSHELRTPIHAILGYSEIIEAQTREAQIGEYAANVEQAGRNLLAVVGDILDYTGIDANDFELEFVKTDTATSIIDILSYAQYNSKKKNLELDVSIDPNIPACIIGDAVRYSRVATNLVSNAIKYTDQGKINIVMTWKPLEGTDKGDLTFSVSDTGIGMKPTDIERISEQFLRIDPNKTRNVSGAGIGLAYATRILQKMNSKLNVESRYGKGSRFWFTIRPHIADATPIGEITFTKEMYRIKSDKKVTLLAPNARILAVDDNAMNLDLFGRILADTSIRIDYAENGRQAIELTRKNSYDMIFMDHMMPVMDGIEALNILRKEHLADNTPIVVLTANAVAGEKEKYLGMGFDDYLSKPVDKQQLLKVISHLLPSKLMKTLKIEGEEEEHDSEVSYDLSDQGEATEQTSEMSDEDRKFIDSLSFLDTTSGLGYCCDDTGFYRAMLKSYVDNSRAQEIIGAYAERNFENYRVFVHAVKGTSLTIGANDLSEHMKSLEFASRDGDIDFVDKYHAEYLAEYEDITAKIIEVLDGAK